MFKIQKDQKTVFSKLYRYYCAKLSKKIGVAILYFLLSIFVMFMWGFSFRERLDSDLGWQGKLAIFWIISFSQLYPLWMTIAPLVSYLIGRGLGWEELQKRQLFRMPKISREEDVKVLIFTPDVNRETVILAKFAAALTYFMAINFFLLALPPAIYLLVATKIGVISAFFFLLLNGVVFGLINFLLIVPFLFYSQEAGSFLLYLFLFVFVMILLLAGYFLREFIWQYPIIFVLAFVLLAVLAGYSFFSLYSKKYLKNDLD